MQPFLLQLLLFHNTDAGLQRRCYWLLTGEDGTVLVHYLASRKLGRAHTAHLGQTREVAPHIWDTARVDSAPEAFDSLQRPGRSQLEQLQDTCMNFDQASKLAPKC